MAYFTGAPRPSGDRLYCLKSDQIYRMAPLKMDFPAKHSNEFKPIIRSYAAAVEPHHSIVELGTYWGAGTWEIADASTCPVYTYDWFKLDQLEMVREHLKSYGPRIHFCVQDIYRAKYDGPPIALFVDDASKTNFPNVFSRFEQYLTPDAVLVLQDFHHDIPNLHNAVRLRGWEQINGWEPMDSCAVFQYKK